jgi:20S proteasome alpha/beta subunit
VIYLAARDWEHDSTPIRVGGTLPRMNQQKEMKLPRPLVFALVSVGALILAVQLHGTCVIAFQRPDWVFLAADSKTSLGETVCKIGGFDSKVFFAIAGTPADQNTGYDAREVIRKGFAGDKPFTEHVEITKELLRATLVDELRWYKENAPRKEFL